MNLCWAFHLMWHHWVGPHISNNRILSDPENRASPLSGADSRALAPLRLSTLALCLSHALRHSWAAAWAGCNVRLLSDSLFHTHTHTPACPTLVYTPSLENSFKADKRRLVPCKLSLLGQFCPSELHRASENRPQQPHSLGCSSHRADREYWKLDTHTTDHQVNRMGN